MNCCTVHTTSVDSFVTAGPNDVDYSIDFSANTAMEEPGIEVVELDTEVLMLEYE